MSKDNKPRAHSSEILRKFKKKRNPLLAAKTESRMLIAARIDDLIKDKKWTKKEFAKQMGRTPSLISKWLSGTHNFTHDTLVEIAHVLGKPIMLIAGEEPRRERVIVFKTLSPVNVQVSPSVFPYPSLGEFPTHVLNPYPYASENKLSKLDYSPIGIISKKTLINVGNS